MTEIRDFEERMARVAALIREIDSVADPSVRASVKELMQSVMDLNGMAVNRMMEIIDSSSDAGDTASIIHSLGQDSLVGNVLVLYGLHPDSIEVRVGRAVERVKPNFRRQGMELVIEDIEEGIVRLRVSGRASAALGQALKDAVQEQIYALAPDITRIEGLANLGATDFVGIENLVGAAAIGQGGH